jgi:hypothetical protein
MRAADGLAQSLVQKLGTGALLLRAMPGRGQTATGSRSKRRALTGGVGIQ